MNKLKLSQWMDGQGTSFVHRRQLRLLHRERGKSLAIRQQATTGRLEHGAGQHWQWGQACLGIAGF